MAIDPTAPVDPVAAVRLLTADVSTDPAKRLLTDDQLAQLLSINDQSVQRAAADALDIVAASEVLVSKKITTQDLATDGPATAAALRARAAQLRERADELDALDVFDVVPTTGRHWHPEHTGRYIEFDGPVPEAWGL